jgi:hypothetical protein
MAPSKNNDFIKAPVPCPECLPPKVNEKSRNQPWGDAPECKVEEPVPAPKDAHKVIWMSGAGA